MSQFLIHGENGVMFLVILLLMMFQISDYIHTWQHLVSRAI